MVDLVCGHGTRAGRSLAAGGVAVTEFTLDQFASGGAVGARRVFCIRSGRHDEAHVEAVAFGEG